MAQPHQIGYHNFHAGISHLSQWTCCDNRDLEQHILPVILGAPGTVPQVIKAVCSLLDFTYIAQLLMHNELMLLKLKESLNNFHAVKHIFITNGSRQGVNGTIGDLNIPKLHMFHHWPVNIMTSGTCDNFCMEIGEALHRIGPKAAYKSINKKEYDVQMIQYSTATQHQSRSPQDWIILSKQPHFIMSIDDAVNKFNLGDFILSICRYLDHGDDGSQHHAQYQYSTPIPQGFETIHIWTSFHLDLPLPNDFYDPISEWIHCKTRDPVLVEVNPS